MITAIRNEFEIMAADAKAHLEKHPMSICEMRIEKELIEEAKVIIKEIAGEDLFKRINFFPKY